jgi:release factor glutamine methyltransferase
VTSNVSIAEAINNGTARLHSGGAGNSNSDSPRLDSQLILAQLLNCNRAWLIAHSDDMLNEQQHSAYLANIEKRTAGIPVAYILGEQEFWSLSFRVTEAVLIPRPETELLVEEVLSLHPNRAIQIADLGTGTGAIAIALALENENDSIIAVDRSIAAIRVAAENRQSLGAHNVSLCVGSWLSGFAPASLDIVVSNPPYIAAADEHLPALKYEPTEALVSGIDGLDDIKKIISCGITTLKPGGLIAIEHGYNQQVAIMDLMLQAGYRNIVGKQDLADQPRITIAERP